MLDYNSTYFKNYNSALKSVGLKLYMEDGEIKPVDEIAKEVNEIWNTLNSNQRNYLQSRGNELGEYVQACNRGAHPRIIGNNVIGFKNGKRYKLNQVRLYGTQSDKYQKKLQDITGDEFLYISCEVCENHYDEVDLKYWDKELIRR